MTLILILTLVSITQRKTKIGGEGKLAESLEQSEAPRLGPVLTTASRSCPHSALEEVQRPPVTHGGPREELGSALLPPQTAPDAAEAPPAPLDPGNLPAELKRRRRSSHIEMRFPRDFHAEQGALQAHFLPCKCKQ